jgi:hypothetical protein
MESQSSALGTGLESQSSALGTGLESQSSALGTGRWLTRQVPTRPNLKIWTPARSCCWSAIRIIAPKRNNPDGVPESSASTLFTLLSYFSIKWRGRLTPSPARA